MSRSRFSLSMGAALLVSSTALTAQAEQMVIVEPAQPIQTAAHEAPPPPAPPRAGHHEHDGFYLRMMPGVGYTSMSSSGIKVHGGSGMFTFSIGGAVTDNLIVFGHLGGSTIVDPKVRIAGNDLQGRGSASLSGIGVGIAYYLMPSNVYFSGALVATQISLRDEDDRRIGETETGGGVDLSIGKEWWVSDNWGLGVAGRFMFASIDDRGGSTIKATSTSIAFTATYN